MIDKDKIEVRKTTINSDIQAVKQRLLEYQEKIKEDTALINALTGAMQQCDYFLKEIDDDEPDLVSDSDSDVENSPEED
jgi:transcriptional antiterminator